MGWWSFIFDTSRPDGVLEKKNGTKGEELLEWSPQVDLDLGIKKTVDWYLNNYEKDNVENIHFENELYASIFDVNNISEGLDFLTSDDSYIQVGTWGYDEMENLLNLISILF